MTDDLLAHQSLTVPSGYQPMNWTRGFGRNVGPLYERYADGWYTRAFLVGDHHTNGMSNCHGGMLMSFADMALGHAVSFEKSYWWVTVRLVCDFVAGAEVGDWVEGTGRIISEADGLYTVRGRVWVGERTVLTASGIFKAVKPREPRPGEKAYAHTGGA